jgi:hypothetical protein
MVMTKRDPHPDNELIARMQEEGGGGQQSRSGGNIATDNGTRAELEQATGGDTGVTRVTGEYNPGQDAQKGDKTRATFRSGASKQSSQG